MYKDVITYKLSSTTSERQMIKIAKQILENWMKHQRGFIKWEIHRNTNGNYTDIVYWQSKEDAKEAEKRYGQYSEWSRVVCLLYARHYNL